MNRQTLALGALFLAVGGLLSVYAVPWVAIDRHDDSATPTDWTTYHSYWEVVDGWGNAAGTAGAAVTGRAIATSLELVFHGFLWGAVAAAIGVLGYLVRPFHRKAGESFALVASLALVPGVLLVLGHVFLMVDVASHSDALAATDTGTSTTSAWYGVNYLTPLVAVAFVATVGLHTVLTVRATYPLFSAERDPVPALADPAPPARTLVPRAPPAPPLVRIAPPRNEVLARIERARAHVRTIRERAEQDGSAKWTEWAASLETYLDTAEREARASEDPATLVELDERLERDVLLVQYA